MQITIVIKEDGEVTTETQVTGVTETAGGASFDAGAAPVALDEGEIEPALDALPVGLPSEEGVDEGGVAPIVMDEFETTSEPPFMGETSEGDSFDAGAAPMALEEDEMSLERSISSDHTILPLEVVGLTDQ